MIIQVWDNGGKTFDRYTIRIGTSIYGSSEDPFWPQGFCQYCGEISELPGYRQGKLLKEYLTLPHAVKLYILDCLAVNMDVVKKNS
jgi:hypothetical protein